MVNCVMQLIPPEKPKKKKKRRVKKSKDVVRPMIFAEPVAPSNSFVGTEEYIAPVRILLPFCHPCLRCSLSVGLFNLESTVA